MMQKKLPLILMVICTLVMAASAQDFTNKQSIKERMLKVARWQIAHPNHKPYEWHNGAFYAGVFEAYEATHSADLMKAMMDMAAANGWKPGPRFDHADDIAISQTYIDLYRLKKDRKMIDATIASINRLKTETGNEVKQHGITWWWCDALFMGPPTLAKLARTTGDKSYLTLNDRFFRETYDRLYDKQERLYARDDSYFGKKEANGQKIFWSRGNGWVVAGLARLIAELPKDHPTRGFYVTQFQQIVDRVASLQQSDGLWRASLLDPASYPGGESSGSGFYTFAIAWGINNKLLDRSKFMPVLNKAWAGLNSLVHEDGMVGWTQPVGADPRKNFTADSWEVYGAGAYLLAASEMLKLKK